jgi:MFS family permease
MAAALTLLGLFSAIYHPVGIPMLLQHAQAPGRTIGINGLAGNLGIAVAALLTGVLVDLAGWRAAFVVPGLVCWPWGCCSPGWRPGDEPPAGGARERPRCRCRPAMLRAASR